MTTRGRRLYRRRTDSMLTGDSGGLADYFDVDPALVRLTWILSGIFSGGLMILVYLAMWIVVPRETTTEEMGTTMERETTIDGEPVERTVTSYEPIDTYQDPDRGTRRIWAGIILVSLGLIFLGNNFGLFFWFNWRLFWPLVLIGAGAWLLAQRQR